MALTYITRTPSSSGNRKIFTFSGWIKRSKIGVGQQIIGQSTESSGNDYFRIIFNTDDQLRVFSSNGGMNKITSMKFRDTSAWYNIVCAFDSSQSTASNRNRIYVNGVEQTSFATNNNVALNTSFEFIITNECTLGRNAYNNQNFFDGLMSHIHFIDGTQYNASAFGSVDSVTGEWQINTAPSVTYGNNGFFILKDSNSVTDQSGKNNNFSVGGSTLTATKDCPSNVFATWNPLVNNAGEMMLLSNGNTSCQSNAAQGNSWKLAASTLGMTSGKYYWEAKLVNTNNNLYHGVMGSNVFQANASNPMNATGFTGWNNGDGGEILKDGNNTSANYGSLSNNDILGIACDVDNYTITIYKNGSALVSNYALSTTGRDVLFPCSVAYNTNNTGIPQSSYNFGNGFFGTTAITTNSGNGYAGAEGASKFNYAVPSGYSALSTKGLNQ